MTQSPEQIDLVRRQIEYLYIIFYNQQYFKWLFYRKGLAWILNALPSSNLVALQSSIGLAVLSALIALVGLTIVGLRIKYNGRWRTKKQALLIIISVSAILFVLCTIWSRYKILNVLHLYAYYSLQTFQLYFFTLKAVPQDQRMVRIGVTFGSMIMFGFFSVDLLIHILKNFKGNRDSIQCEGWFQQQLIESQFDELRTIQFIMQIIFCFVGKVLQLKYSLESNDVASNMTLSQSLLVRQKLIKQMKQLWYSISVILRRLIMLSLLGSGLLLLQNMYYMLSSYMSDDFNCRIVPDFWPERQSVSDTINTLLECLIIVTSNQMPQLVAIQIFWFWKWHQRVEDSTASVALIRDIDYYQGLSLQFAPQDDSSPRLTESNRSSRIFSEQS